MTMKRFLTVSVLFLVSAIAVMAQGKFKDRLEADVEGQGKIRIYQDDRLTAIINADYVPKFDVAKKKNKDNDMQIVGKNAAKIRKRGYRIQVYKGSSSRADEAAARSAGRRIQLLFDLEPYIIYNNPDWVCRVGDFKTREDAVEYLKDIRKSSKSAMIVPSEIFVRE